MKKKFLLKELKRFQQKKTKVLWQEQIVLYLNKETVTLKNC
jgi:hypothetical protein